MKLARILGLLIALSLSCSLASAAPEPIAFDGAKWIWYMSGPLPAGVGFFRAEVNLPEDAEVASAEIIITCDNLFALYLNGLGVGECKVDNSAWGSPKRYDVAAMLTPGRNVLAVEGVNTLPGAAALIAKLVVRLADGRQIVLATDAAWKAIADEKPNWQQPNFDDSHWPAAHEMSLFGVAPWNKVAVRSAPQPPGPVGKVHTASKKILEVAARQGWTGPVVEEPPAPDFPWPEAIVFLGDDCSLYRPLQPTASAYDSLTVTIFNPRKSRAFPEHDLPAPMKVAHKLFRLAPARPGVEPKLLLDAGRGAIGSPSVSFDGESIYVSMARADDPLYHIYRVPAAGGPPEQLTDGPFHDIDPAELPDGRIVFTSTRVGTFEEYHNPPSRALFVMNADGSDIRPLTYTIIFDNEPEVLADVRILFIRSDNFFDRGKVETLLHAVHTDGTEGYTEFGIHAGPEYGGRLRANLCGSPAPMPDGRVAFLSGPGIAIGRLGAMQQDLRHYRLEAGDVAALPNGRLLCTTPVRVPVELTAGKEKRTVQDLSYQKIGVLDPRNQPPTLTILHESTDTALHSPVYLGPRPRPPRIAEKVDRRKADRADATGVLFCQNARFTRKTTAGWPHVRAIRVLAGKGLTTRSSHSYIVHAGSEVIELGTVPLAPDGSFSVEVPADTPLAFQAVDAEGRSELNEMSWIYVRPGERRGCVGCHHTRQAAPIPTSPYPLALETTPLKLLGRGRPHRFRGNNAAVTGLMNMQIDRYREVAGINRHSESTDPLATGAEEVAVLVAQLESDDPGLKTSAAQRLSIFRNPAAAPALAQCLGDASREVRVAAAIALAACGTRESVAPLLTALEDRAPLVGQAAAVALENLTAHPQRFNPFADKNTRNRQARAWRDWFAQTPWEQIEQDLAGRIDDPDRDVVRRAAVALGHVGTAASRPALRDYVVRQREVNPLPEWRKAGHQGDAARFNSLSPVNPRSLQAVTRSIGYVDDAEAVSMLAETIAQHDDPETGNLFLAEAAVEALGRIGTPEAEAALVGAFAALGDYPTYTYWYGDHSALMSCHASPVHYFIAEALDALGSTRGAAILPHLIRSVPIDPDRALLLGNDDCETLTGRVIRRHGAESAVVETCLSLLGDPQATPDKEIQEALSTTIRCWGGHPDSENRAAQILSLVCRDRAFEPRIRAAFERYREKPTTIPRVFDTGIPVVLELPAKHWVCFFLARSLGNLAAPASTDTLIAALDQEPAEAAGGRPDPLGPGVLFLHNDLTPCWRAAAAWALGQIGDTRATAALLAVVGDLENAPDTRHAAAEALGRIADPATLEPLARLAKDYPEVSTRRALLEAHANVSAQETAHLTPKDSPENRLTQRGG
ncbi:MAG: HEAT repeat domain-containing protein [Planctomycetes bacterium]|nr:HEAT repeat domain-containing protein [Planctomycetota bacterium]